MYDRQEIIDQLHDPDTRKPWELVKGYEVPDTLTPLPPLEVTMKPVDKDRFDMIEDIDLVAQVEEFFKNINRASIFDDAYYNELSEGAWKKNDI